ncbi:mucin-2-like [Lineus longissimus]|uniref:mucin-2-like n=1 Tax=Lineus longissimus TaxID=88925 RepID=UPI00315D30CC
MPITDDIRRLELAQLDMTAGLFTVLDNILSSIAPPAPPVPKIKAGGHPEDIFVNLTENDKDEFECCVCYMILKDAQQCKNKHKFCSSCIMAWTLTSTSLGADKCPVCRCEGEYVPCDILNARLSYKRVKCQKEDCDWTGFLKDFESHEHNQYNAAMKPGVKRSLPAVAGTIKGTDSSSTRPRPTISRGVTTNNSTNSSSTVTPSNPTRPTNRGQASNALRTSGITGNTRSNQARSNSTTGTTRAAARPTPRPVRQASRQSGLNASGTQNRGVTNTRRQVTNAPSNAGSSNRTTNAESSRVTPRPNSVARAVSANRSSTQAAGSQTSTSLPNNEAIPSTPTPRPNQTTPSNPTPEAAGNRTSAADDGTETDTPRIRATLLIRRRSYTPNRIVSLTAAEPNTTTTSTSATSDAVTQASNESEEVPFNHRPTHLPPISAAQLGNNNPRIYRQNQFRQMAEHIRDGRSQLHDIMGILNNELETRRQSIARHQEFQERQHAERLRQLHEVHTLGRRLGEVASNLAVLMNGLRQVPTRRNLGNDNNE